MRKAMVLLAPAALAGCATVSSPAPSAAAVEAEARAFMADYAADLREHDREGIAARYDADGAWMIFAGERQFVSAAKLREQYTTRWQGPKTFAWRDLAYEVAGPDSVVVVGGFDWGTDDGVERMSYTGLLRRRAEGWRIRMENEGPEPAPHTPQAR